jgi:hypothetical protein
MFRADNPAANSRPLARLSTSAHFEELAYPAPDNATTAARTTNAGTKRFVIAPNNSSDEVQPLATETPEPVIMTEPAGPVTLTGHMFSSKDFDPPHREKDGMQLLKHYGAVAAETQLPHDVSRIRIRMKPRPQSGSNPVVGVLIERIAGGKYSRAAVLKDFELKNGEEVVRDAVIPKGTYRVTVQFFRSSAETRTHVEVYSVTFE